LDEAAKEKSNSEAEVRESRPDAVETIVEEVGPALVFAEKEW